MQPRTRIFSHLVADYLRRDPVIVPAATKVADLLERMAVAKRTSALIIDGDGRLTGIITEQDVTRRIALRCNGEEAAADIMSSPVRALGAGDHLYYAIARMRRFGWRHMPVVDRERRPIGVIDLPHALAVAAEPTLREIELISQDDSMAGLKQIKQAQVDLAESLFADKVPAPEVQAVISRINRDIHCRIIDRALADMAKEGRGAPPVQFELLIMGSGGRGENYLYPDQDNGFILDDYPDAAHNEIDPFFIDLAERMTKALNKVGFPYCNGYVMATNPLWRKTRSQWRAQIKLWGRKRSNIMAQLSDIFFDFQGAFREVDFAEELRADVTKMARKRPAFLQALFEESDRTAVALGWFGRLIVEKGKDKGKSGQKGKINLKHRGTLPLVTGLRLLSLRHGIAVTSTLGRIAALHEAGVLDNNEADELNGAFNHITGLLLRQQLADFRADKTVGNFVHPKAMSRRERNILVDSLRAIESLGEHVRADFTGEVF